MWACRRFLMMYRSRGALLRPILHRSRRVNHLLLSTRGHASDASSDRRRDYEDMAAKPIDDQLNRPEATVQPPPATEKKKKKYLYLVLDDTNNGVSIHKLDIDGDVVRGRGGIIQLDERPLPSPPVLRMDSPTLGDNPVVCIVGSNIVGVGKGSPEPMVDFGGYRQGVTVCYDTKTAALTVHRDLPNGLRDYTVEFAAAVGNRMYVMESGSQLAAYWDDSAFGAVHCLKVEDTPGFDREEDDCWSWHTMGFFSPSRCRWWSDPSLLPLSPEGIRAHALHPDGRAFFVSVEQHDRRGWGTFSYSASGRCTRHGDWQLPFRGQAHYDAALGAWIGLRIDPRDKGGYLCSCDVPPPLDDDSTTPPPRWKLAKKKLFFKNPARHIDAKLVPMGGGQGRFCLVEILTRQGVHTWKCLGDGDKCVLRLTTFRVKYNRDGHLIVTARRPAGLYKLSRYVPDFNVQAAWM